MHGRRGGPEQAPQVASWVRSRDTRELFTSSITLAEIRYGLARFPDGRRKQVLIDAADDVFRAFSDQVLPVDVAAAQHYAISRSLAMSGFDALIAAICRSRGAALATRNRPDFDGTGIDIVDPWASARG